MSEAQKKAEELKVEFKSINRARKYAEDQWTYGDTRPFWAEVLKHLEG